MIDTVILYVLPKTLVIAYHSHIRDNNSIFKIFRKNIRRMFSVAYLQYVFATVCVFVGLHVDKIITLFYSKNYFYSNSIHCAMLQTFLIILSMLHCVRKKFAKKNYNLWKSIKIIKNRLLYGGVEPNKRYTAIPG